MKNIAGFLVIYVIAAPAAPAAAQSDLERHIERITEYALRLAEGALGDLVDAREQARDDRAQRRDDREARGPEYKDTVTRTVRLGRDGRLQLDNLAGDVAVTGTGGDEVKIVATKVVHAASESAARPALDATAIDVNERPGLVTISANPTRGRFGGAEVDYAITVPTGTSLTLKAVSGDITVSNVDGEVQLNSLSGDIVVKEAKPRGLTIESVSGDISLEQVDSPRIHANVISGDITFTGTLAPNGRYELRSHSGDIQVIPEGNPGFDVEATTFSGDVSSDFPLRLRGTVGNSLSPGSRGTRRNSEIRGTASNGGALLTLQSFSGDILITKR